jgi:hypothetical protein
MSAVRSGDFGLRFVVLFAGHRAFFGGHFQGQIRIGMTTYLKPALIGNGDERARVGVLQLDRDHLLSHVGEGVDQVGDVEADLDRIAAVVDLELLHRLFLLGVRGGDAQRPGLEVDAHALELVARQDRSALQALQQRRPAEGDSVLVVLRDDAVVVGELAFDELGDELHSGERELRLVRREAHLDRRVVVLQQPLQLEDGLARQDDLLLRDLLVERRLREREPMARRSRPASGSCLRRRTGCRSGSSGCRAPPSRSGPGRSGS